MFLKIIVKEIMIQTVLKTINVGNDFLMLAHISNDDVVSVKKCNHQISLPKTRPGTIIAALDIQAANSIVL
jgi:hypothetical protein